MQERLCSNGVWFMGCRNNANVAAAATLMQLVYNMHCVLPLVYPFQLQGSSVECGGYTRPRGLRWRGGEVRHRAGRGRGSGTTEGVGRGMGRGEVRGKLDGGGVGRGKGKG